MLTLKIRKRITGGTDAWTFISTPDIEVIPSDTEFTIRYVDLSLVTAEQLAKAKHEGTYDQCMAVLKLPKENHELYIENANAITTQTFRSSPKR